ncbi:hypothetical protein AB0J86_19500 [Micromonospora sp. NPDC049559]|uniref:hypothetical protein n=1 Tax=Micromonospora sp. NPDC049559 TaxID=3155923 RepID=UPI00343E1FDD
MLYGVWLRWGLLYVGQTMEAERRLRDLPIGESHHLATTFPPEIWHRVVVVAWPRLPEAQLLAADATPELVGLALEHTLQLRLNPLANSEKRTPDGNWRAVVWEARRSRGARYASQLGGLVEAVHQVWDEAASQALTANTASAVHRVVFPETLVLAPPAVADPSPPHLSHLTHR